MLRTEYDQIGRTQTTIKKKAIYESEDLADKTYEGIISKYTAYRFEEHTQMLKDEFECQSYSYIMFFIGFKINDYSQEVRLFSSTMEIFEWEGVEYLTNIISDDGEDIKKFVNDIMKRNYDKIYIKAEMET